MDFEEIYKEMREVPFGNSVFQIENFCDVFPSRRKRHILLQLNAKIQALKKCEFRRDRIEVELRRFRRRWFKGPLVKIDIAEKEWDLEQEKKLIHDAIIEVNAYKRMLEQIPKMNRIEFEKMERGYWQQRLIADAHRELKQGGTVLVGTLAALNQLGIDAIPHTEKLTDESGKVHIEKRMRFVDKKAGGNGEDLHKVLPAVAQE